LKEEAEMQRKMGGIRYLQYALLVIYTLISVVPIYFSIVSAFKKNTEIFSRPFALPEHFTMQNFVNAWKLANVGVYLKNSFIITLGTILLLVVVGTMASYVLSRFQFKLKNTMYLFFIVGMMIPIHSTMIPLAYDIGFLQFRNHLSSLILVIAAFSISLTVFILTGFMKSIPGELEESAVIDGCTIPQVFRHIIFPLSIPAVSTASIFNFLGAWNNLLFPLIFISDKSKMPLSYGLLSFFAERTSDYGGAMAAVVMSIVPPIVIYFLLQEQVQSGLTAGAVKG
jgi:raffinose/stachyose/melibiose transport system permease protein